MYVYSSVCKKALFRYAHGFHPEQLVVNGEL